MIFSTERQIVIVKAYASPRSYIIHYPFELIDSDLLRHMGGTEELD